MGIPVWQPYLSEHKRQRTRFGEFECECFPVPHNGTPNVGYLIKVGGQVIAYITDMEFVPYSLTSQNIDTMIVECNYMKELVPDDLPNKTHKILGHAELETTIGILQDNLRTLKHVILVHMGNGTLDRDKAMERIREGVPEYITVMWARADRNYDISDCPF